MERIQNLECKINHLRQNGMTLVELLVAVCVISLIVLVGVMSYQSWILGQNRQHAITNMQQMQMEITKQFDGTHHWVDIVSAGKCLVCDENNDNYQYSINNSHGYTIIAQPVGHQLNDDCGVLRLQANGKQSSDSC